MGNAGKNFGLNLCKIGSSLKDYEQKNDIIWLNVFKEWLWMLCNEQNLGLQGQKQEGKSGNSFDQGGKDRDSKKWLSSGYI